MKPSNINTPDELQEAIAIQLEQMGKVVQELLFLRNDVGDREPTFREVAAGSSFLAQFYTGIENILKCISYFHKVPLPTGDTWHIDLFQRFCHPPYKTLPELFNKQMEAELAPFRKFRHVVHHGYTFDMRWDDFKDGINVIEQVFAKLRGRLQTYCIELSQDGSGSAPPPPPVGGLSM